MAKTTRIAGIVISSRGKVIDMHGLARNPNMTKKSGKNLKNERPPVQTAETLKTKNRTRGNVPASGIKAREAAQAKTNAHNTKYSVSTETTSTTTTLAASEMEANKDTAIRITAANTRSKESRETIAAAKEAKAATKKTDTASEEVLGDLINTIKRK